MKPVLNQGGALFLRQRGIVAGRQRGEVGWTKTGSIVARVAGRQVCFWIFRLVQNGVAIHSTATISQSDIDCNRKRMVVM